MEAIAELRGAAKRYGAVGALAGVDLTVRPGQVAAVLGPNGAGKTTALNLMLGLRRPDRGEARLFGMDPVETAARLRVGAVPQVVGFPENLRVREVLNLVRRHFPDPEPTDRVLRSFGLEGEANRSAGGLSPGRQRQLALAAAFSGRPRMLFLDEPSAGLDVESRRGLWERIRRFVDDGGTVLLSTHHLEEAEALANRVVLLAGGRVVAEGTVDEVRSRVGLHRIRIPARTLPDIRGVERVERSAGAVVLHTGDPDVVVSALVGAGVPIRDLQISRTTLEEAFLDLTGGIE